MDSKPRRGGVLAWMVLAVALFACLPNPTCYAPAWDDVLNKPRNWLDMRRAKQEGRVKERSPDFKKRDGTEGALWLDDAEAPDDIFDKLEVKPPGFWMEKLPSMEEDWENLVKDPSSWQDCRPLKDAGQLKDTYPDFKNKDGIALWLNEVPMELSDELEQIPADKFEGTAELQRMVQRKDAMWKAFFDETDSWLDNRESKSLPHVNDNFPDFSKRSPEKEGLWMKSAPEWALEKLDDLEKKFEAGDIEWPWQERDPEARSGPQASTILENPGDWIDFRPAKMSGEKSARWPDFKHVNDDIPFWIQDGEDATVLEALEKLASDGKFADAASYSSSFGRPALEPFFKDMTENTGAWRDYRADKASGAVHERHPDFKNFDMEQALWLTDAPEWFKLEELEGKFHQPQNKDELFQDILENPGAWLDFTAQKASGEKSEKFPDFKNPQTEKPVWADSAPDSFWEKVEELQGQFATEAPREDYTQANKEAQFQDLLDHFLEYVDHRAKKQSGELLESHPDFTSEKTEAPVWLADAPDWFAEKLEAAERGYASGEAAPVAGAHLDPQFQDILDNPGAYTDFREQKASGQTPEKFPDFKNLETDEAVWVNNAPDSFFDRVDELEGQFASNSFSPRSSSGSSDLESKYQDILDNPGAYADFRADKASGQRSERFPDFKNVETDEAVWVDNAPDSFFDRVDELEGQFASNSLIRRYRSPEVEARFQDILDNPDAWTDFRADKASGQKLDAFPDFKNEQTDESVWLNDAPDGFMELLDGNAPQQTETVTHSLPTAENAQHALKVYKELLENPGDWEDHRSVETDESHADFVNDKTGEQIWLSRAPDWFIRELKALTGEA